MLMPKEQRGMNPTCDCEAFRQGLSLRAAVFKKGLQSDVFISNHVLNLYAKCGCISFARQVFDKRYLRNLVSWSAMISGYDRCGEHWVALELFSQMRIVPNGYVFASVVSSCASLASLEMGRQAHAQPLKYGYASFSFVSNSLISMYMKCEEVERAFRLIRDKDVIYWNTLITAYFHCDDQAKGLRIFHEMMNECTIQPDDFTYSSILAVCAEKASICHGKQIRAYIIRTLYQDVGVGNELV
ncbi:hypothetical protein L6164_014019 [Bauhinia variegata]|uniref:Uncharacterized protein n=1 Tax=Bauhinia variegata TaxID=167791 RepID=A0ACB9NGY5_BAUVA|nr:hypothetical protein L6164_014019 [Bauhinia variegata]